MNHKPYRRQVPGSQDAVLMVHGIAGSPDHFAPFLDQIPENWSVYNLLLDGHGGTVADFGRSSMEKWKNQVHKELDGILQRHSRVRILAHSMGTLFAIREAVERPAGIVGLFLLNPPLRVHYPPSTMALCLRTALGAQDGAAQAMRADTSVQLTPRLWQYICWTPRFLELLQEIPRVRKLLPRLAVPAVFVFSGKDELVSGRSQRDLPQYPGGELILLENSCHFAYTPEELERLKERWQSFLKDFRHPNPAD